METTGPPAPAEEDRKRRKASKEQRRAQLIEATIDCLARLGYAETTLADVAQAAGLSRGIVNFHFESKEKLLIATLQFMADEYAGHWRAALKRAGPHPADQLAGLILSDFDRSISSRRKLAAWVAFWGEAKSRPTYLALCGARDTAHQNELIRICTELAALSAPGRDPRALAFALDSMLEGIWLRLMMGTEGFSRTDAIATVRLFLALAFPGHFATLGPVPEADEG